MKLPTLSEIRKAYTAFTAGAAVMLGAGLITGDKAVWISSAIAAVAAGIGTYAVKANDKPASPPAA